MITADNGTRVITDPYTPETAGYLPITDTPDVVIISSDNDSFHCRADLIPGNPLVINALKLAQEGGHVTEKGIPFQAIAAMEALDHQYHDPDQNGMYRFTVDGVSIGHLGDMGNELIVRYVQDSIDQVRRNCNSWQVLMSCWHWRVDIQPFAWMI